MLALTAGLHYCFTVYLAFSTMGGPDAVVLEWKVARAGSLDLISHRFCRDSGAHSHHFFSPDCSSKEKPDGIKCSKGISP